MRDKALRASPTMVRNLKSISSLGNNFLIWIVWGLDKVISQTLFFLYYPMCLKRLNGRLAEELDKTLHDITLKEVI